jgi:hypothetical protein
MAVAGAMEIEFARRGLGNDLAGGEPRATHRRPKRYYKKRVRMPSKLDPHAALIEGWVAPEPQLTAIAIVSIHKMRNPLSSVADHFGELTLNF